MSVDKAPKDDELIVAVELFLRIENEFDPVLETVKNPILPDPVIPEVN